jgi:hypothetical protein
MFETLFGAEMPLAIRFFLAFLISLGLIGTTAWAVLRFGTGRLGGTSTRARWPRLAVVDHASVDESRQLILVQRDNVEHLLMIGGWIDVVVEANIVRAEPAAREVMLPRPPAAAGALPRTIPMPESGSWPLQPEPVAPARRMEPVPDEPAIATSPPKHTEPTPGSAHESLAALAEDAAETVAAADQSLAELAHRIEAALRKPNAMAAAHPSVTPMRAAPSPVSKR